MPGLSGGFEDNVNAEAVFVKGSITDVPLLERVFEEHRFEYVYHLAAYAAEGLSHFIRRFNYTNNLIGSVNLINLAVKHEVRCFVFTSSIAVFGPPYPDKIGDEFLSAPQTSYGAQKAISELMLTDFIRKGIFDGLSIRLPTICVRPGKANLAASSFFSGIIREPLNGQEARLPVPDTVRHWHATPRSAAGFLRHAATLDLDRVGSRRALNMPGVSCTVAEQIEALRQIAGEEVVRLIKPEPDEAVMAIVKNWPRDFAPERALALGFKAEDSFAEIIQTYIDEDLHLPQGT